MAGRKYSDIYKVSNTNVIANTDLFIVERANGNTYAFTAQTLINAIPLNVSPNRTINVINATSFTATTENDILLCNTVAAGANITIYLPATVDSGKSFTVKMINTSGASVIVTTDNTEDYQIESAIGGTVTGATSLTSNGEVYTWIAHGGVYRKI